MKPTDRYYTRAKECPMLNDLLERLEDGRIDESSQAFCSAR
jgi:hypothetical protein